MILYNQLVTRGIKHWGLSGYSSIIPHIKFAVTGQESSPQSPTISYRQTLAVIKKMNHEIDKINKVGYQEVVDVWEASVKATHHFLPEEEIEYFKPLILNTYLDAVELRCIRNNSKKIVGFLGVADQNLEMLFIHSEYRGKRVGKTLLDYSINILNVNKVDVNEQNQQAVGFYKHCGFETISRSELDSSGKPYPTLHMELKK